jgi:hypothetical protein
MVGLRGFHLSQLFLNGFKNFVHKFVGYGSHEWHYTVYGRLLLAAIAGQWEPRSLKSLAALVFLSTTKNRERGFAERGDVKIVTTMARARQSSPLTWRPPLCLPTPIGAGCKRGARVTWYTPSFFNHCARSLLFVASAIERTARPLPGKHDRQCFWASRPRWCSIRSRRLLW